MSILTYKLRRPPPRRRRTWCPRERRRAGRKQCGNPLNCADPARGNNWDVNRSKRFGKDVVQALRSANMTTRLDALSHDEVATGLLSRESLAGRACLPRDECAAAFGDSNQIGIWIAVKELDDIGRGTGSFTASLATNGIRNPIPIGLPVRARALSMLRSTSAAEGGFAIIPRPPASETAAASAGVPIPPSDASWIGSRQFNTSVNAVI